LHNIADIATPSEHGFDTMMRFAGSSVESNTTSS
jgi:hypothetical protein